MMNLKWVLSLLLFCCSFTFYGQSNLNLPTEFQGYFHDQEDRLVLLARDFFYLEDVLPQKGFFQRFEKLPDGSILAHYQAFEGQSKLPSLKIKRSGDGLSVEHYRYKTEIFSLKRFDPLENHEPLQKDLRAFNGTWYCGMDDLVVRIDENAVSIGESSYQINDAFQNLQDKRLSRWYVLDGAESQQLIKSPSKLDDRYFAWSILGRNYEHCRKQIAWPFSKSIFFEDLPHSLTGTWAATEDTAEVFSIYEDYSLSWEGRGGRIRSIRKPNSEGKFFLEFQVEKERFRFELQTPSDSQLLVRDSKNEETIVFQKQVERITEEARNEKLFSGNQSAFFLAIGIAIGLIIAIGIILNNKRKKKTLV